MRLRAPRWLLLLEAALLLGALLVLGYKAAMWIRPLEGFNQTPHARKVDPRAQLLQYYREYPGSYIHITRESWRYNDLTRVATHSFVLKNSATVPYHDIEILMRYESGSGNALYTHTARLPGMLTALGSMDVSDLKISGVPPAAANVVASVARAVP